MGIIIDGQFQILGGDGEVGFGMNNLLVWVTPEGSLGSLFEPNTITSSGFQVEATDADDWDTIVYSLYAGELPNSTASGDITFTGQPNANDTIVVNGNTWEFVAAGATGLQSNIGGTLALTLDNLVLGLNADATASIASASYSTDPKGYKAADPASHVTGIKGRLLVVHGTSDTTVMFQSTIHFLERCIQEGVAVDTMVYPGQTHGLRGKHFEHFIRKMTRYFSDHLRAKPASRPE